MVIDLDTGGLAWVWICIYAAGMDLAPLHAALEGLDAEIAQAEAERAEAEARLHESGSELANEWISLPRSEAVARVLAQAGAAKSPTEIAEALEAMGRDDDYRDVAAALSHLKSRGRAKNVSRGSWVLVTEAPDDVEGPDPDYEA